MLLGTQVLDVLQVYTFNKCGSPMYRFNIIIYTISIHAQKPWDSSPFIEY